MIQDSTICFVIVGICIFLFVLRPFPNAVTAVLGCIALAATGVSSLEEAFSGFSNSTVLLMFGMMVLGIAMQDTGVANLLGNSVARISKQNERIFILSAGVMAALLSTFLSNTAVIAIFLPIIESVSKKMNRMNITLPVTMGAMFGGVCTLVGSTPQLTANGILSEMCGTELSMFSYTLPGICITAVYMLYVETVGYKFGNRIWGDRIENSSAGTEDTDRPMDVQVTSKSWVIGGIFLLTMISFIGGWISNAMTAVIAAVLCLITGCTTQKSVIKKMDWSVVFVLAGCLGLASGISSSGAGEVMSEWISNILPENVSAFSVFCFFVFLSMGISNFITNSTAVVIVLPIALALCNVRAFNPLAFTLGIVFAANLSFSTPLANAQTAMTLVAGYRFSDYIRYTWLLDILVYLAIILFVPLACPLAF